MADSEDARPTAAPTQRACLAIHYLVELVFKGSPPTQQRGPVRELGSMDRPHGSC